MRLIILFDMFFDTSFKITTSFASLATTTATRSKFRKDFKSSGIFIWRCIYETWFLILNELKTSLMLKFSLPKFLQSFESLFLIWYERLLIYGNLK